MRFKLSSMLAVTAVVLTVVASTVACLGDSNKSSPTPEREDHVDLIDKDKIETLDGQASTTLFWRTLPDGKFVMCIWVSGNSKSGLSCDWDKQVTRG